MSLVKSSKNDFSLYCFVLQENKHTLDICLQRLKSQTIPVSHIEVQSQVDSNLNFFNHAVDKAYEAGADFLIYLNSSDLLHTNAIEKLITKFNTLRQLSIAGGGFDILTGYELVTIISVINIRLMKEKFSSNNISEWDMDLLIKLGNDLGLESRKINHQIFGYHHPIWTPQDIFFKFRFNVSNYRSEKLKSYLNFINHALTINPGNITLQIGRLALMRGWAENIDNEFFNHNKFVEEFNQVKALFQLKGCEFFAYHQDMIELGYRLFGNSEAILAMGEDFFTDDKNEHFKVKNTSPSILKNFRHVVRPAFKNIVDKFNTSVPNIVKDVARIHLGRQPHNRILRILQVSMKSRGFHGEINTGRADWEQRWKITPKSRRVLMVAPKDFAGSMFKWAEALNRFSNFAVRLVSFEGHPYGYDVDLVVPECDPCRITKVLELADEAGFLHLKDEHSWFVKNPKSINLSLLHQIFFSPRFSATPKIFTHYGGYARRFKSDESYIAAVLQFDLRIAMTPDLNYPWFNGEFIPHAIDVDLFPFEWKDSNILSHSPSSPEKKGTYMLEEAFMMLNKNPPKGWLNWSVDLIHGVSHFDCMIRKKTASLFFDQAGKHRIADLGIDDVIGWYGNSAIEAMAFGIPTIAYMSDESFYQAKLAGINLDNIPVINMDRSRDGLMKEVVSFVESSHEERLALAEKTRAFTVEFHGYEAVARRLVDCYMQTQKKLPKQH